MTATYPAEDATALQNEWTQLDSDFQDFVTARRLDGTWKSLEHLSWPPNIRPELKEYVQGAFSMFGGLSDDLRLLIAIHGMNATRINVQAAGTSEASKKLESDHKLTFANWWTLNINRGRWLDNYNYEGQSGSGFVTNWLRWRKQERGDGVSGCPVYVEKVLPECIRYKGDWKNPSAAWLRYSVSAVDCDVKTPKGERPSYMADGNLGWVSEGMPYDYKSNSGKQIEVIVRDAEDPVAMCPLEGCYHRKRRITIYVCKEGAKTDEWEEVESYDSPFERCSFIIVGADVRETERNPHYIFRPSAWILFQLADQFNQKLTELAAMTRRELSDDTSYINAAGANADVVTAIQTPEGGTDNTVKRPEIGSKELPVLPGPVQKFPGPALQGLLEEIRMIREEYQDRRPNRSLLGQQATSEVSATVGQLQVQGAGVPIGPDLAAWDVGTVRIFEEIRHGIRFTSHFEPDGEKTRYVAMVTGKERVYGKRSSGAGEEVFLDAKKCEHDVLITAETSKDTPSETSTRRMEAITALHEGVFTMEDVDEAWDIFDHETQEEKRAEAYIDSLIEPYFARLAAAYATGQATARTGVDFGALLNPQGLLPPESQESQTHNTEAANAATSVAPTVNTGPTGSPTGGSTGLAGG